MMRTKALVLAFLVNLIVAQQTPVIGGTCKLGDADVQIGGKQTQFFLKCEATSESSDGQGVWVVKSRSAASGTPSTAPLPQENTQPQQHPKITMRKHNPNICEQDNGARENEMCAVSATCLQATNETPISFLQCEQTSLRWVKKSCQDGFIFNFEQQACVVPKRAHSISRQQAAGLVCTFSSCSNSNPCSSGTCNNGYCCTSGSSNSQPIIFSAPPSSNCVGCGAQAAPQIISIPQCPGGSVAYGTCNTGYCATGYTCVQGSCCPSYSQPSQSIAVYTCPGGGNSVGSCVSGGCATGYMCTSSNTCCPSTNPFVCPDGTQAAGGCVNGLCGSGYSCSNGLCCASTSQQPKCLDGSPAVGACMPSCTGNACGQSVVTYYCGTGYTCTTGNICCPINSCPEGGEPIGPPVNGLCPTGYSLQGNQCCSIVNTCLDGETNIGEDIHGLCPTVAGATVTLRGRSCCQSTAASNAQFADPTCPVETQLGPCLGTAVEGDPCGGRLGYACKAGAAGTAATDITCCPMVDFSAGNDIGPALVDDECPIDYTAVTVGGATSCFPLSSIPGLCTNQLGPCLGGTCPGNGVCNVYADVCCAPTAFSRLRNSKPSARGSVPRSAPPKAIGTSCTHDVQCAGNNDGLSKCENRVCRCTSVAYAQGIACVRRKMLMFNDAPMPTDSNVDTNTVLA